MLRPSVLAIVAAMLVAAPTFAADLDDWGNGDFEPLGGNSGLREGYPTEPKDWSGNGDMTDPVSFVTGVRYWYSMGALAATSSGTAVSSSDTSQIGEVHLRIDDHSTNTFAHAIAGYSITDQTTGSTELSNGHIGYLGADLGWNALDDHHGGGVGPVVGYLFWQEQPAGGRANFTTATSAADITYDPQTGQTFLPGDSAPDLLNVHAIKLGVEGKADFGMFDISGQVSGIPYAKVYGTLGADDPTFNTNVYAGQAQFPYENQFGNIQSMRSSLTDLNGWGYGATAEAWLGFHPADNMVFRVGGRAWYLQGTADATYTRATIGNPGDADSNGVYDTPPTFTNAGAISVNNPFSLFRYGALAEFTYSF